MPGSQRVIVEFKETGEVVASAATRSSWLLEPGRTLRNYLRAAQAYMLISMPTGTSTIFGVFQVIWVSHVMVQHSHRVRT